MAVGSAHDQAERAADRTAHAALRRLSAAADPAAAEPVAAESATADAHAPRSRTPLPAMTASPDAIGAAGGDLPAGLARRIDAARPAGQPLPAPVLRRMESAFGTSFGDVRIHQGAQADQLGRALGARAFTTGKDIFFGAGQFQPGSRAGQQVLAHELAHTQQGGPAHRHMIHRWNINAPVIDWTQATTVGTVDSGQAVWFFKDTAGDTLVVKNETQSIGLSEMSAVMHERLSGVKSVRHRKLGGGDKQAVEQVITDPQAARLDRGSWSKLGAHTRTNDRYMKTLAIELGDRLETMSDFELGHYVHASTWQPRAQYVAMTFAEGETAKAAATREDRDTTMQRQGGQLQTSRLRHLMTDLRHVRALGKLTAVDLFLGNRDRVMAGNLGNWIYDPESAAITAIDHVDGTVGGYFGRQSQSKWDLRDLLAPLTKPQLMQTAKQAVDAIADGAAHFAKDAGFRTWLDSDGGNYRANAEEAILRGLEDGRKLLIKTFTATRFSGSKKDRAAKKAIKAAARQGRDIDTDGGGDDRDYYYQVLKARAEYLKKN